MTREPFKLRTKHAQQGFPQVRLRQAYYLLVRRIHDETGLPLGGVIEQCIDYALANGSDYERELLALYTEPPVPAGCPLLDPREEDEPCPE